MHASVRRILEPWNFEYYIVLYSFSLPVMSCLLPPHIAIRAHGSFQNNILHTVICAQDLFIRVTLCHAEFASHPHAQTIDVVHIHEHFWNCYLCQVAACCNAQQWKFGNRRPAEQWWQQKIKIYYPKAKKGKFIVQPVKEGTTYGELYLSWSQTKTKVIFKMVFTHFCCFSAVRGGDGYS